MAFFTHKNLQVSYDLHGEGKDILFLHGLAADKAQVKASLEGLNGYRIISLDMPGHGETRLSNSNFSVSEVGFNAYAEVAGALLQHLGIRRVVAGGISMGAGIALNLALSHPGLIRALLLVRPAWLDRPARPHLNILEEIGSWLDLLGLEDAEKHLETHPTFNSIKAENPNSASSIRNVLTRPQAVEAAGVLRALIADQPFQRIEKLGRLSMPALVIGNNADPLHPSRIAREIQGALGEAVYFHAPPRYLAPDEHRTAVVETITRFLSHALQAADA
ncbi:alpha/beta fold hydrolase [Roseibium sp.]|uniref:alpha/beta fold hydrolase n=1 Tax=Roseibium sp. TaxID=1936156 RepID=UPI003B5196FF